MQKLPGDVIVLPEAHGRWVVMNVFAHTSLGVESESLQVLRDCEYLPKDKMHQKYSQKTFKVWEIKWFSNYKGLFADPTRYVRNITAWPESERLNYVDLVERFISHYMIIDDEKQYRSCFGPKTSLLDRKHFGNFHQQLGQELILAHRESADEWWVRQKFTSDLQGLRTNLYKSIQGEYLKRYFQRKFVENDVIVDLGCGIGFYSNLMALTGAKVLGIDPNEGYIKHAREYATDGASFEIVNISKARALDHISTNSADYIFMSDALLFYFVPIVSGQVADIGVLCEDIKRILKPGGTFISMDPHYLFWLQPWLGDNDRPFTILTEYLNKTYGVTPSISSFIKTLTKFGFAITWMEEPTPDPDYESVDPRAYHFSKEFPQWQLYELRVV